MSAAAAYRRRDVNASDAIADVLHPNMGYREKLRRRGVEPKNYERANRLLLKKQQAEQRVKKQAEAMAKPEAFKLSKFKAVQPRVFQEKSRLEEATDVPKRHEFLRRGASASVSVNMTEPSESGRNGRLATAIATTSRATAGSAVPLMRANRPKRQHVKPPIPSRQELEALNEQLAKLHHEEKPDFVTENALDVIHAKPAEPLNAKDGTEAKHDSFGRIPEYLLLRKEQWIQEEEERRRNMPDPDCPPGMVRLDENKRISTLNVLLQSLDQAQQQVSRLPLRIETLNQIRRKDELLARLQEIEDAVHVFSKSKVYVAKPVGENASNNANHSTKTHRRFQRRDHANASAA